MSELLALEATQILGIGCKNEPTRVSWGIVKTTTKN